MVKRIQVLVIMFLIIFSNISLCVDTQYVWSENRNTQEVSAEGKDVLNLESQSAILIEASTGKIIYEKEKEINYNSLRYIIDIFDTLFCEQTGKIIYCRIHKTRNIC